MGSPVNLAAAGTSFLIILPAELPDKTVLACIVMGSRYRPLYVFAGAAAAFTVHVALAVTAGGLPGFVPPPPGPAVPRVFFLARAPPCLRPPPPHTQTTDLRTRPTPPL